LHMRTYGCTYCMITVVGRYEVCDGVLD
jgi:hypothetical protein